ncbi:glycosyltransferase [Antarcticimicrobium luteum]|uniref:glycosyltransferase n=1 Tax=Antarcticimicrobium luteum TaxID=2547397 RepID=UPI001FE1364B|nr:glycosyltransferase [Antarcticimicrobium luteum]
MSEEQIREPQSLVAVVVTYNRLDKLRAVLARLLESPQAELQAVVVIDNASTDGTGAWLAAQPDPRLVVMTSAENLGGAGGFETGMRLASERFDPDWMVVMDDDARPAPGALAAFHAADKTGCDAVAAAVYFPDGRICEMNRPSRNPFWHGGAFLGTLLRGRGGFHIAPDDYRGEGRWVDVASFVGLFVSRAAIGLAGYPDGRLFVYGEDGIFTLALSKAGGRIRFAPAIAFEHDCSTLQGGQFRPLWKVYYYHRNLLFLYRMAAGRLFWPALLMVLPKWLLKLCHHPGERITFLRLLGRAVADGLRGRAHRPHGEVLALAGAALPGDSPGGEPSGSESRGDSAPSG